MTNISQFAEEARKQLFHIGACECCDFAFFKCKKDMWVPMAERDFLVDQQNVRLMGNWWNEYNNDAQINN